MYKYDKKLIVFVLLVISLFFPGSGYISTVSGVGLISEVKNIPNPFKAGNENTLIRYFLSEKSNVSMRIYNLIGGMVRKFDEDECTGVTGINNLNWDGKNSLGRAVADGCYLCVIIVRAYSGTVVVETLKVAVVK